MSPASAEDVEAIVRLANEHRVPLHPYSRGRNWGLGSRLPNRDGAVLLDLGRLNRILEINAEQAYAVVETGVTQGQLYDELRRRGLPLRINVIGSSSDSSLVGNAMERGIGYFGTRAGSLTGIDVVFGSGQRVQTGYGHLAAARTTHVYGHGIGPSLDGLLYQSNFGVVVSAGIPLLRVAEQNVSVIAKIADASRVGLLVDALADLRRREVLRMTAHIANRLRTYGTLAPLVRERLGPGAAREDAEALLRAERFGPWSAVASLQGSRAMVKAAMREVRAALAGIASVEFYPEGMLERVLPKLQALPWLPWARRKAAVLGAALPIHGLASGIPTDAALPGVDWLAGREPSRPVTAIDEGGSGYLYFLPLFPLDGVLGRERAERAEAICAMHGFEPAMTLNILDGRCLELVLSISFDRADRQRVEAAHRCIDELHVDSIDAGYPPYRVGVGTMEHIVRASDPFWQIAARLKDVLDPNGIIAPGRYNLT